MLILTLTLWNRPQKGFPRKHLWPVSLSQWELACCKEIRERITAQAQQGTRREQYVPAPLGLKLGGEGSHRIRILPKRAAWQPLSKPSTQAHHPGPQPWCPWECRFITSPLTMLRLLPTLSSSLTEGAHLRSNSFSPLTCLWPQASHLPWPSSCVSRD